VLPEQPATFRRPTAAERPWSWRLEDGGGAEVDLAGTPAAGLAGQRFPTKADAESWVGEVFGELAAAGVDQVTLFEHDRRVYGPMSLHP
jgi:hypothetical protein